jgi:hypothetical protein
MSFRSSAISRKCSDAGVSGGFAAAGAFVSVGVAAAAGGAGGAGGACGAGGAGVVLDGTGGGGGGCGVDIMLSCTEYTDYLPVYSPGFTSKASPLNQRLPAVARRRRAFYIHKMYTYVHK